MTGIVLFTRCFTTKRTPWMPPAKSVAKKTARKPAKQVSKRPATRELSASHKKALAEGRTMSATVDRYLSAVNTPKRRGRKVSKAALASRLAEARAAAKSAIGIDRLLAAQEVRDLQTRITNMESAGTADIKSLEAAFVKIAKQFGENRGIGYGAWRDAGGPSVVLKKAGVARTRGLTRRTPSLDEGAASNSR